MADQLSVHDFALLGGTAEIRQAYEAGKLDVLVGGRLPDPPVASAEIPHEIRLVEWIDSSGMSGWNHRDEVDRHGIGACVSVGFVVREDETQVMLAASVDRVHDNVGDVTAIPRFAITAERTLDKP